MGTKIEKMATASRRVSDARAMFFGRGVHRTSVAGNLEPRLADILTDPIMLRLMASDGIHAGQLIDLIADVKLRLERRG